MMGKKTVVIGASEKPGRYANMAVHRLRHYGHEVVPIGLKSGIIEGLQIMTGTPAIKDVDTVTLYIRPSLQPPLYDYILSLQPKRIIFNPGTENDEFALKAMSKGIETEEACTLVMLSTGGY
jgi:predicted CoA-binding protein